MAKIIVQINYNFWITEREFEQAVSPAAELLSKIPGLEWKIWLKNTENKVGGGIYLFNSRAAAEAYLAGPIVKQLKNHPAFTEIDVKLFNIMEAQSTITRAPVFDGQKTVTFSAAPASDA